MNKKKGNRALRIFGKITLGLAILILLLLLFIRSPWGQGIIKDQLLSSISEQTNTEMNIDKLFITFSGNIQLEGLYLEDQQGDTLIYSNDLEADIPLWPIIRGKGISVNSLNWTDVRANITREDSITGFNFDFLVEAFSPADTTATVQDTATESQELRLGEINLSKFDIVYKDKVTGIDSRFQISDLNLEMEETDLDNMVFHASRGAVSNAVIDYKQSPVPDNSNDQETTLPVLMIDFLELEDVRANYESVSAGMNAKLDISEFAIGLPRADLANNAIEVTEVKLNNSEILLHTQKTTATNQEEEMTSESTDGFQWPDWKISVADISLKNNTFTYLSEKPEIDPDQFDPKALRLEDFDLIGNNVYLENEEAGAHLENLSFRETSGLRINDFSFKAQIGNQSLRVEDLLVKMNENHIEGDLNLTYDSLQGLLENPENTLVEANLPQFRVDLQDLFLIQPELRQNEQLEIISQKPFYGQVRANGTLASLDIPLADIHWGRGTTLSASGTLRNTTIPEELQFDFPSIRMVSNREDIRSFIDEEQLNLTLPDKLNLSAEISGSTESIVADATLSTSSGEIVAEGKFSGAEGISFDANMEAINLDVGRLFNNEQLGVLNLSVKGSGEGDNINELDANVDIHVSSFQFNDYPIKDLNLTSRITNGKGPVNMDYQDENLEMALESMVFLDSVSPQINMSLDVAGANLQALGLTQRNIRVALELDGSFKGNAEAYDINAEIEEGVAVYDQDSYLLGDFGISARVRPDSTAMDISNQILDANLRSNSDPGSFARALQRHYQSYLSEEIKVDTIDNPVNLQLSAEIRQNPILDQVFVTNLQELDTVTIDIDFHERNRELTARVNLPFINFMGNEIDSLSLAIDSDRENLDFVLGFDALNAGPVAVKRTALEGTVAERALYLDFNSYYGEEHLMQIQSEIRRSSDTVNFTLNPSSLILNGNAWSIPENNRILMADSFLSFQDFEISRNNQRMEITDENQREGKEHIAIKFDNFNLASILSYLNPDEPLASGRLEGDFTIEEPFGTTGLLAGIRINDFNIMEVPMGNLSLDAEAVNSQDYSFDLAIKEGNADLDLTGGFRATEEGANWDTELILNEIQMAVIEGFSLGEITDSDGSFSGNIQLSGTFAEPEYQGELQFNEAVFTVSKLDVPFRLPSETMRLDTQGIYFDEFQIEDQENNFFTINGDILTETFLNPEFDLNFRASDFMAMNSSSEDHDLFYGKAVFDVDGNLTGTLNIPQVQVDLTVDSTTDLTYIIPESEVGIEERDGVVLFVNKENPDDILTASEQESYTLTGMEVSALLEIEEDAVFNIIIDEQSGDNFQVTGSGDLNFNIFANGRTTLSGRYEMSGGHYEMSLYGLVNRRFEVVEGSSITWAGDPLNASLDLRARYRVETSASALMEARTAGAETSVRDRFRQELPFLVYLDIGGELMQPVLNFGLDMPEDEQGSLGGEVYGMVQQVNQQEQELNKQVFSLLVLNRFYPESGSDGSGGGTMALARDNLNSALSDQLNMLSNNLLGDSGFELDFGLDSFTDYQGENPQQRTQLDITAEKSFMDDRLVVRVGSEVDVQGDARPGETSPLIGNVSIDYLLTETGKWRLRGFRRNRYENVIEGQVIVSGLALIFTREFNEFRELWNDLKEDLQSSEPEE